MRKVIPLLLLLICLPLSMSTSDLLTLKLDYNSDSAFDVGDQGIESESRVIDFTVENSNVDVSINQDNLCTKWSVENQETHTSEYLCFGSPRCCNFIDENSLSENWYDPFYLNKDEFGAGDNNKVHARIIHVDFEVGTEQAFENIFYSEEDYLYAVFVNDDYFADGSTEDQEIIKAVSTLESIKTKNPVTSVSLSDTNNQNVDSLEEPINIELNLDSAKVSLKDLDDSDVDWEKLGDVLITDEDDELDQHLRSQKIIPQESVTLLGLDQALNPNKLNAQVEFDTTDITYNSVIYCTDDLVCNSINLCSDESPPCYVATDSKVIVQVPHFSSVILGLNASNVTLTLDSPNASLLTGEFVHLNFTTDVPVSVDLYFDGIQHDIVANITSYASQLEGTLLHDTLMNGVHNISFDIYDQSEYVNLYNYSFTVADNNPPVLTVSHNSLDFEGDEIHEETYTSSILVTSDEFASLGYAANDGNFTQSSDIGLDKSHTISGLTFNVGSNVLRLNSTDLQGNNEIRNITFDYATCSDGIASGFESGLDCGGPCNSCIDFSITTDKTIYEPADPVKVTVVAREDSLVNLTVTRDGVETYNHIFTPVFPGAPISEQRTIDSTSTMGNYSISAILYYVGTQEEIIKDFMVNDSTIGSFAVSISANDSQIDQGQTIKFTSTVSGNSSKVDSYLWKFGDGITSTLAHPVHTFSTNGTFQVNLTATWDDYQGIASTTITSRNVYNITIAVKNSSGVNVRDAIVTFDGEEKNTTASGSTSFRVNGGDRNLRIEKIGYVDFENTTEVNRNFTHQVRLPIQEFDVEDPIIEITLPEDNITILETQFLLQYKVLDSSDTNCTIYLNMDKSWWIEAEYDYNIRDNGLREINVDELESRPYEYKIECTDKHGNSGESPIRNIYVNITNSTDEEKIAEELIAEIDRIISNYDKESEHSQPLIDLEVRDQWEESKRELTRAKRDLHNLVWRRFNDSEQADAEKDILERIENTRKTTIRVAEEIDDKEFVDYARDESITNASREYLEFRGSKLKDRQKDGYTNYISGIQTNAKITTRATKYKATYLSGDEGDVVLIEKTIDPVDVKGLKIVENIPKELVKNTSFMTALFEYETIKADPIILIDPEVEEYKYYFSSSDDLDEMTQIKSVLVSEEIVTSNPIVGFAVLGDTIEKLSATSNLRLFIEVLVIVVLVIIYIWLSGGFKKLMHFIKHGSRLKHVREIRAKLKTAHHHLKNNQYDHAKNLYHEIGAIFKELPKDLKKEVFGRVTHLSHNLDYTHMNKLLDKADYALENNNKAEAQKIYNQVNGLYKRVSPKFRQQILDRCKQLHTKLSGKPIEK